MSQQMGQEEIRVILNQVRVELMAAAHSITPPTCSNCQEPIYRPSITASYLEQSIRSCVESTLDKWAPRSEVNSSPLFEDTSVQTTTALDNCIFQSDQSPLRDLLTTDADTYPEGFHGSYGFDLTMDDDQFISAMANGATGPYDHHGKTPLDAGQVRGANEPSRRKINWEIHRRTLEKWYVAEKLPLSEVMKKMREEYSFLAS
ncbi:hypothetical protein F4777DRAFT_578618 [Nemania sp. FL0916]|nr:hypothetical protein F4777DRAFT_578618 [Nemania sp. FL0916]